MGILNELYIFKEWLIKSDDKPLTTGEIALWYSLKACHPDGAMSFTVSTYTLEKMTGLSHKGLYKAREGLIHKRLINYTYRETAANKAGYYNFLTLINENTEEIHTQVYAEVHKEVHTQKHIEVHKEIHTEKQNSFRNAAKQFRKMLQE